MVDFRKMAEEARLAQEAARQADKDQYDAEKTRATSQRQRAEAALRQHVMPLLEQAKEGYSADGVHVTITEVAEMRNPAYFVKPVVKFSCWSNMRAGDGYRLETSAVFFSSDGGTLWVGAADSGYDKEPKKPIGSGAIDQSEAIILMALQQVIDRHHKEASQISW